MGALGDDCEFANHQLWPSRGSAESADQDSSRSTAAVSIVKYSAPLVVLYTMRPRSRVVAAVKPAPDSNSATANAPTEPNSAKAALDS